MLNFDPAAVATTSEITRMAAATAEWRQTLLVHAPLRHGRLLMFHKAVTEKSCALAARPGHSVDLVAPS